MIEGEDVKRLHESVETVDVLELYLRRLERKVEIMLLDAKAKGLSHRYDLEEVDAIAKRIREVVKVRGRPA